jgi:ribosomal protein S3
MGHPVNPVSFRLGIARGWNFTASSLENNHHQFFYNAHSRNVLNFFKRLFNTKVVQKLGFIFSHISMFNGFNKQNYLIFFYDGLFEANNKFFYSILKKKIYRKRILQKHKILLKEVFFKKARKFYRRVLNLQKRLLLNTLSRKKTYVLFLKNLTLEAIFELLTKILFDIFCKKIMKKEFFYVNSEESMKIFSFFFSFFFREKLKLIPLGTKINLEKIIAKINNFLSLGLLKKMKKKFFLKRLVVRLHFFKLTQKMISFFSRLKNRKLLFFKFFVKFLRAFLFTSFFRVFLFRFKKFLFPFNFKKVNFIFKSITRSSITAPVIAKYICVRLSQKYSMKEILKPVIKDLISNRYVSGFKISCCGRFTKKEIATFFWKKIKKVSLSQATSRVEYSFNEVILKYSICGVKVWLQTNPAFPIKEFVWNSYLSNFKFLPKKNKKKFKKAYLKKLKKKKKHGFISKKNKIQKIL